MITSIINNYSSGVQAYMFCSNTTDDLPSLDNLSFDAITFVGSESSADILSVDCIESPKYLIVCIWSETAESGYPDSYATYDKSTLTIKSQFVTYKITLSDTTITITAANGKAPSSDTTSWWVYILVVLLAIIVIAVISGGIYFIYRNWTPVIPTGSAGRFIL